MAIAILLLAILSLCAIALIIRGWIGQRIDDHPLCRRCGFDLTGRPPTSRFCPECGAELAIGKSIAIGHHRRRWGMLSSGALLLVVILATTGGLIWTSVQQVNWLRLEPAWWLLHVARQSPSVATPELAELTARLADGRLSTSQAQRLEDAALAVQADQGISWNSKWGDLLESAHAAGKLSSDRWTQYARQAMHSMPLALQLRPSVRQGDRLPYLVTHKTGRAGQAWPSPTITPLYVSFSDIHLRVGNKAMPVSGGIMTATIDGSGSIGSDFTPDQLPHRLPLGIVPITGSVKLQVMAGSSGPVLASEQRSLAAQFRFVPPSTVTVTALPDDSRTRAALEKAIHVEQFEHSRNGAVRMQIAFNPVPVPISYRVLVQADGKMSPIGTIAMPADTGDHSCGFSAWHIPLTSETAAVILKADPAPALDTTDTFQYFRGSLVLTNMVVKQVP